ncbi:vitamin B12 dependent-methionine synthase activation domain-containing protein [Xanthomonas campestris]|uniref:vitamin B12 dependent-methionine synthase activation domain-containing protein n=1 Tax=Xanthomonas campestris TaxID=339 RepID=UPI003CCFEB39
MPSGWCRWKRHARKKFDGGWDSYTPPPAPARHVFDDYPLDELIELIDWTPFFQAWELAGKFPAILSDEIVGPRPASCIATPGACSSASSKRMADRQSRLRPVAANSVGDDVEVS